MRRIAFLLTVAALAAGCGSSNKTSTGTLPAVLPAATSPDQWAVRIVELVLRPLNQDLQVVNAFNTPTILVYIANKNPTTLTILRRRLGDLALCSKRLVAIGPPPPARLKLKPVDDNLELACASYVHIAQILQKVTLFVSSDRADVVAEGKKLLLTVRPEATAARTHFTAFLRAAQGLPEFRRAGLKPSA